MFGREPDHAATVEQLVQMALSARKDGLLSLEPRLGEMESPVLKSGLLLAIDGREPEIVREVMRAEIDSLALRQRDSKAILDQCGRFAPAFGMIGTLLGLIIMLGNLSDPATIGSGMAVAMVTTLYGLVLANGLFLPLAEKLAALNRQEILGSELVLRGVLSIQAGEHPRVTEQKLAALLPPADRPAEMLSLRRKGQTMQATRRAA
jgi:chemotaxis protein MotA